MPQPHFVDSFSKEDIAAIEELAARFFDGSGDRMSLFNLIKQSIIFRRALIAKRGPDAGE
jgi:hypothetical protein